MSCLSYDQDDEEDEDEKPQEDDDDIYQCPGAEW
jgi:hypothetical protein